MTIKRKFIYLCFGLAGAGLIGFVAGSQYYSRVMVTMREQLESLPALVVEKEQLEQRVINLEMADKVNRLAQENIRQRVSELQAERIKLEGELYVYKKLLEDDETEQGLSLERVVIKPAEGESRYYYDIVLRRKATTNKSIEANLSGEIEGQLHGIRDALTFKEADPDLHEDTHSVTFKYFKVIKGYFVLPEHFVPEKVVLSLYETGDADSLVIKEIPWEPTPN